MLYKIGVLRICRKSLKNTCGRLAFLEKLQAARSFKRFLCLPSALMQILLTYSEACIFLRAAKYSSPEAIGEFCSQSAWEIFDNCL